MRDRPEPAAPPVDTRKTAEILASQAARRVFEAPGRVVRQANVAAGLATRALRSPARSVSDAISFASSLRRVADPATGTPSPLLRPRSLAWRFEAAEVPLADLKAAAKSAGGSVNDALMSSSSLPGVHDHPPDSQLAIARPSATSYAADGAICAYWR